MFTGQRIAAVSVINDLVSDQRVKKICLTLGECGYSVLLIGRKLKHSPPLPQASYRMSRMRLLFTSGPLFYFFFNLRLFFKLLFTRCQLLYANDLDTLLPNFLVSKIRGIPLIYDSHELFCEVPELIKKPVKQMIWQGLEKLLLPKLKFCITVNNSIAAFYAEKYKTPFSVVRNISDKENTPPVSRSALNLPEDQPILILQGAGINIDRGAEELVQAMKQLPEILLLIIGSGDVWSLLERTVRDENIRNIRMIPRLPRASLLQYTSVCDMGLSIDKNTNLNYYYSLPNKLFDYIHAGIPVLASRMVEIEHIVNEYQVGEFIDSHHPDHIASRIRQLLQSPRLAHYKSNCIAASGQLSWQSEKLKLAGLINAVA